MTATPMGVAFSSDEAYLAGVRVGADLAVEDADLDEFMIDIMNVFGRNVF